MSAAEPLLCPACGQRGDRRPGIAPRRYPEAVGFTADGDSGMTPVQALQCLSCNHSWVVPVGTVEIRKES